MTESTAIADDVLYEVIDGQVVEKPAMGAFQSWVANVLLRLLNTSDVVDQLGQPILEVLFQLDSTRPQKRRPDLAFVSFERWPRDRPIPDVEAWEVVPDLAVEVISKSNTAFEVIDKVDEYFQAGVRLIWMIYPNHQKIYVYTSPTQVQILRAGDDLDGGSVLPGFRVPVRKVFGERD